MDFDDKVKAELARIEKGGAPKYHQKNAESGKLFARERVKLLLDADSFVEDGAFANAKDPELPADGVITGLGRIAGRGPHALLRVRMRRRAGEDGAGGHRGGAALPVVLSGELLGAAPGPEAACARVQRQADRRDHPARSKQVLRHVRADPGADRRRLTVRAEEALRSGGDHGLRPHRGKAGGDRRQPAEAQGRRPLRRQRRQGGAVHLALRRFRNPHPLSRGRARVHDRHQGGARRDHPPRGEDGHGGLGGDGPEDLRDRAQGLRRGPLRIWWPGLRAGRDDCAAAGDDRGDGAGGGGERRLLQQDPGEAGERARRVRAAASRGVQGGHRHLQARRRAGRGCHHSRRSASRGDRQAVRGRCPKGPPSDPEAQIGDAGLMDRPLDWRATRRRFAVPSLVCAAILAAAYVRTAEGTRHPSPWGYRLWSFAALSYSDILALHEDRGAGRHPVPYVEDKIEYPVLLGVGMWFPSVLAPDRAGYFALTFVLLAACALLTLWWMCALPGTQPWIWAASPALLVYGALNWDLFGILPLAGGLFLWAGGRERAAAAALSLAVWTKLFPVLALGVLLLISFRGPRRRTLELVGIFAALSLAVTFPFALFGCPGWDSFFGV